MIIGVPRFPIASGPHPITVGCAWWDTIRDTANPASGLSASA